MVDFTIHENSHPFKQVKKIQVPRDHYDCAMIVNDKRSENNDNDSSVLFVMYSQQPHPNPCKVVKLNKTEGEWDNFPAVGIVDIKAGE